jgi:hypothetical protein
MALVAGTVSVNPDGSVVSSGLAKAIYDEFVDNYLADTGQTMPAGSASVLIKKGYAVQATRTASAMVSYFTANAEVSGVEAEGNTLMTVPTVLCLAGGANVTGGFGGNTHASTGPFSGGPFKQPAGNSGTIS